LPRQPPTVTSPASPLFTNSRSRRASFRVGSLSTRDKMFSPTVCKKCPRAVCHSSVVFPVDVWEVEISRKDKVLKFLLIAYRRTRGCFHRGWAMGSGHPLEHLLFCQWRWIIFLEIQVLRLDCLLALTILFLSSFLFFSISFPFSPSPPLNFANTRVAKIILRFSFHSPLFLSPSLPKNQRTVRLVFA